MRVAVVGASGRTGREVVTQVLKRGHLVTAIARHPDTIAIRHDNLTLVPADVLERDKLIDALAGCQSVVSALGIGTTRKPTVIYSQGTENVLVAMEKNGIDKVSVISAVPAGSKAGLPFLPRTVGIPILNALFGATYRDMRLMEELLRSSGVNWISLRPGRLIAKPAIGQYRIDTDKLPQKGQSITCADLATALIDVLERDDLYGTTAYVAN